jgi:hypothetical protein
MGERHFPLPCPESGDDPRFCSGLLYDIREVLTAHGYPTEDMTGLDLVALRGLLFRFLYADTDTTDTEGGTV